MRLDLPTLLDDASQKLSAIAGVVFGIAIVRGVFGIEVSYLDAGVSLVVALACWRGAIVARRRLRRKLL